MKLDIKRIDNYLIKNDVIKVFIRTASPKLFNALRTRTDLVCETDTNGYLLISKLDKQIDS